MNYRNRPLLDRINHLSQLGEFECTWPLDHACCRNIEAAHSNQQRDGKGAGIKAHDYRIALICHTAHAELDQGKSLDKLDKLAAWESAHRATVGLLFEAGVIDMVKR